MMVPVLFTKEIFPVDVCQSTGVINAGSQVVTSGDTQDQLAQLRLVGSGEGE